MPAISYQNIPVYLSTGGGFTPILTQSVSIQYQTNLKPNRTLTSSQSSQFETYGINSAMNASVSLSFYAETSGSGSKYCLETLTGNTSGALLIGGVPFNACYLNTVSVAIQPFTPVLINAEFISYNPTTGETWSKNGAGANRTVAGIPNISNYTQKIVYGHSVSITNGSLLSESSRDAITYAVTCARTPRYTLGSINTDRMFLDTLEKEISIKSTNITKFINYSGYNDTISIGLNDETGKNALSSNINFSAARLMAQTLTAQEGDTLVAEIKAKEVIL
jgi:hypothetical protein